MKHGKVEKIFDINIVLMMVYAALETIREEHDIELVFDINSTVPKELKGDSDALAHLLTHLLRFVIQQTQDKTVVLSMTAPGDFLYMEEVRFEIDTSATNIHALKAQSFFKSRLKVLLERLEAVAEYNENEDKIVVKIPFKLKDLGNRRYYRLPDIRMVGKKVLLICQNKKVAESIKKMFKYFLYEVDEGAEAYKQRGSNLAYYDIFVIDRVLLNEGILQLVNQVQMQQPLRFVILDEPEYTRQTLEEKKIVSAYLVKPVLQESIFDLIVALYEEDSKNKHIHMEQNKPVIDMGNYIDEAFKRSEEVYVQMQEEENETDEDEEKPYLQEMERLEVLNVKEGIEHVRKLGMESYEYALEKFIEKFNRSDYYLKEIVKGHAEWQIKEFVQDLEKEAVTIGAERLAKLAQRISMIYVYKQWDKLERYVVRYHAELKKLIVAVTHYLKDKRTHPVNKKYDKMARFE
jgi:glycerol-3-phosphate cytidylyltransferase-like family protein